MTCPRCSVLESKFSRQVAEGDRKRYQRRGPDPTTTAIIKAIQAARPSGGTLLDVGGGIGVIAHELLARGSVDVAVQVEAAPAYVEAARSEAESRGTTARWRFIQGDLVEVAGEVPSADAVTLDRVVCCYPDYVQLLAISAAKCGRVYALSYPRDRWYVRLVTGFQNLARRLLGNPFRTFLHAPDAMQRILVEAGLVRVSHLPALVWAVDVYARR